MGSNTKKRPRTNLQNCYKNEPMRFGATTFAIVKLKEQQLDGRQYFVFWGH